jgi:hypothetical protein
LGGVLVLLGAPQAAFLINGSTFLVSAATLLYVRIPPREAPERPEAGEEEGWMSETLAGFRFLFWENEGVLAFLTLAVVSLAMVGGVFWTLTVVLAEEAYGLGGEGRASSTRPTAQAGSWAASRPDSCPPGSGSPPPSSGAPPRARCSSSFWA